MLFKAPSTDGKIKKRKTSETVYGRNFPRRNSGKKMITGNFVKKAAFFLLVGVFAGVVAYMLFFSSFVKISKIVISGENWIDENFIRQDIEAEFSGKYLDLVDRNNILFISSDGLRDKLLGKYEKIKEIRVKKVFPNSINVVVEERLPMMILCSRGECFAVDVDGFTYMRFNPGAEDAQLNELMRLTDNGNKEIPFKNNFLPGEYARYVADIQKGVRDDLEIELSPDCQTPQLISGDIRVMTTDGWWIYFDAGKPIRKELEMLRAVLREKIDKEGQRDNLEYIDLRVDNKVFYKLKNQDGAVENPDAGTELVSETKPTDDVKKPEDKKKKK